MSTKTLSYSASEKVSKFHKGDLLITTILNSLSLPVIWERKGVLADIVFLMHDDDFERKKRKNVVYLQPVSHAARKHDNTLLIHEPRGELINSAENIAILKRLQKQMARLVKKKDIKNKEKSP